MELIKYFWLAIVLFLSYYVIFLSGVDPRTIDIWNLAVAGRGFVFFSFVFLPRMILQWYRNEVINREVIALQLFFLLGAVGWLANIPAVFLMFAQYRAFLFWLLFIGVGLFTTFATSAGFVGIFSFDKKAVLYASLKLLCLTILFGLLSFYELRITVSGYRGMASILLGLIVIQKYSERLRKKIAGVKVSDWSFKW